MAADRVHPLKLASLLLQYRSRRCARRCRGSTSDEVGPASRRQRAHMAAFLDWWRARSLGDLQRAYVEELRVRQAAQPPPHLPRARRPTPARPRPAAPAPGLRGGRARARRGGAARLPAADARVRGTSPGRHGGAGAAAGRRSSWSRRACARAAAPTPSCSTSSPTRMPGLSARQVGRIRRLAAEGPPTEQVGLEPFAPPEVMPPMSQGALLLYGVLPYVALAVFVVGTWWRYRRDQYGWGARSTQLLESRVLRYGSVIFHVGVLAAIGGHVLGILVPRSWTAAVGLSGRRLPRDRGDRRPCGGRRRDRRLPDPRLPPPALPAGPGDDDPDGRGDLRPAGGGHRHRPAGHPDQPRRRGSLPRDRRALLPPGAGLRPEAGADDRRGRDA